MTAPQELLVALISALRADPALQAVLGQPIRLFDAETIAPAFPYAVLQQYECRDADGVSTRRLKHRIEFATYTRHGGMIAATDLLSQMREAIERATLSLSSQRLVHIMPAETEVFRTHKTTVLRGVLRLSLYTEQVL
ncbi:MAG: DUF3168 domain-containing protein [Pseudomonadota bacterium]